MTTNRLTPQELPIVVEATIPTGRILAHISPKFDFDKGDFVLVNGNLSMVANLDNLQQWAYKALITPRYRYPVYSWQFGNDLFNLIGTNLLSGTIHAVIANLVRETLLHDSRIMDIRNIQTRTEDGVVYIQFVLVTQHDVSSLNEISIPITSGA